MHQAASPVPSHAAGARRAAAIVLLMVLAVLGASADSYAGAAGDGKDRPLASAAPDPAGEGRHDTAEGEHGTLARIERTGRTRVAALTPVTPVRGVQGTDPAPGARGLSARLPREGCDPRCVVLRC